MFKSPIELAGTSGVRVALTRALTIRPIGSSEGRLPYASGPVLLLGLVLALLLALPATVRAELREIAQVTAISGGATATNPAFREPRELRKQSAIYPNDTIQSSSGEDDIVEFTFTDDTRVILRRNTTFSVESYDYPGPDADGNFAARIARGFARFVTGKIAKRRPRDVAVRTSVATIGVRGTDFDIAVTENADPSQQATELFLNRESGEATAVEITNNGENQQTMVLDEIEHGCIVRSADEPPETLDRQRNMTRDHVTDTILRAIRASTNNAIRNSARSSMRPRMP